MVDVKQNKKYFGEKFQMNPPISQSTYLVLKEKSYYETL